MCVKLEKRYMLAVTTKYHENFCDHSNVQRRGKCR